MDGCNQRNTDTFIEMFDVYLGSIREPLIVLDAGFKVLKANHSFDPMFKVKPGETEGRVIYSSGSKLRLVDELKTPFKSLLSYQKTLKAIERDHI